MSRIITNDYYIALECKDLQANAMSVDSTGTYALLAGRKCIALRNLDEEYENIFKFPRTSKYDVGAAEWNPTSHNKEMCVISSNERLEILNWRDESLSVSHSLRAHSRVITDINWHRFNPNILATCSVDTFIHLWDIRDARKPTLSLSAVAEASQVRWNRISQYLIATAHEGDIKIWDQRKGTSPVQYIAAHLAKIYGLDWSPHSEHQISSSSQDNTVKFFDVTNPRKAEYVLSTNAPVWRARYTPFGNGLVTVVIPQLRRGENSLLLWNIANRGTPMHTFVGHRDVVLEFQWRSSKPDDPNFELVTWSKDQTLLVWKIEPFLQKLCGYEPDDLSLYEDNSSVTGVEESSTKSSRKSSKIQPLQQEFSLLNVHIPNLEVKNIDSIGRIVTVTSRINNFIVNLQVSFPNTYPHGVPPVFQIVAGSNINESMGMQLLKTLNHLAQQRVSKNRTCLEPCLRQMVTTLEQLSTDMENDGAYERAYVEPTNNVFGGYNDAYIPFPRTSGAKFCSVNTLVCFGRPLLTRRLGNKTESGTPRALSALEGILAKRSTDQMTVSAYYFQKQKQRSRSKHSLSKASKVMVYIYDATNLFLINRQLAEEYILDGDVATICKHNAAAAAVVGRRDLVQAWTLAELVLGQRQADEDGLWSSHPCGNKLMVSLIKHYAAQSDLQMAAMLCCIYGKDQESSLRKTSLKSLLSPVQLGPSKRWFKSGGSPYHTIPPADVVADGWVLPILLKTTRSTSLDNLRVEELVAPSILTKSPYVALYEYYKMAYADTLHRWALLYNRAEVMKYMTNPPETYKGAEFIPDCQNCQTPMKISVCTNCKKLPLHCIICNMSVRGSVNCCTICGHGGHTEHLERWFGTKDVCPKCGCHCLFETFTVVSY